MNVVVAGLSPREEAAFGMFLGKTFKDWSWRGVPAGRGADIPASDLLVADLVSLGLAQWSEAAEAQLLGLLKASPVVVLLPAHDQTWMGQSREAAKHPSIVWLRKPYGTEEMLSALHKAGAVRRQLSAHAEAGTQPPHTPVARRHTDFTPSGEPTAPDPGSLTHSQAGANVASSRATVAQTGGASDDEVPSLSAIQLQARLLALPDPGKHVFLRQLSRLLLQASPFEARFTFQHSLIVHPQENWVASNTPLSVIERVCQSDAMASVVTMRAIESGEAESRAQRLGMPLRELETFLWELVAVTLDGGAPL